MQQFDSDNPNSVSQQEAQEILATWANRRQAQGVDPGVNSVSALASGLGVSEEEVRQMLEDIRVHKRSKEIAAGILDHQRKERKRSDVNAAIVAAVILVMVCIGGAVIFFAHPFSGSSGDSSIPHETTLPPLPPRTFNFDNPKVVHAGTDGHLITFKDDGITDVRANGNITRLSGQAAIDYSNSQIKELQPKIDKLKAEANPSDSDQKELINLEGELETYQNGIKLLQDKKS